MLFGDVFDFNVNVGVYETRAGSTDVKSIYLLNVVVKQESLIRTQKTKQATYCPVACNRAPFITRYCVKMHVRIEKKC